MGRLDLPDKVRDEDRDQDPPNKVAIALAAREAMRKHRKGKQIGFQPRRHP